MSTILVAGGSSLSWSQNKRKCIFAQQTTYPSCNTTELHFGLTRPEHFTVYLRIPAWAEANTRVSTKGKRIEGEIVPGKFLAHNRGWQAGDRVQFRNRNALRLEPADDQNRNTVALMRGPGCAFRRRRYSSEAPSIAIACGDDCFSIFPGFFG